MDTPAVGRWCDPGLQEMREGEACPPPLSPWEASGLGRGAGSPTQSSSMPPTPHPYQMLLSRGLWGLCPPGEMEDHVLRCLRGQPPTLYVSPIKSFKSRLATWLCSDSRLQRGRAPHLSWERMPPRTELPSLGGTFCSKSSRVLPAAAPRLPSLPCGFHGPHSAGSRHEAGPGRFQLPPT